MILGIEDLSIVHFRRVVTDAPMLALGKVWLEVNPAYVEGVG